MRRTATLGQHSYTFSDLPDLLAKATPERSGDQLAGLAAQTEYERVAAQMCLADVALDAFLEEPVIPYESDEVTRLILDSHDAGEFGPFTGMTVGALRDTLLDYDTDISQLACALTPEMVAAVSKIMRNQDLVAVASRCSRDHRLPGHDRAAGSALVAHPAQPPDRRSTRDSTVDRRRAALRMW